MTDTMLPILRQFHDADGDRPRAETLLRMPDAVMLKYHEVIHAACWRAGFEAGADYLALRVSLSLAVRDADGRTPHELTSKVEQYRAALSKFVNGDVA